jgi:hypothetical protein
MDHPRFRSILTIACCIGLAACNAPKSGFGYELATDTIRVTKVIDRCNYQYLSADPKKAKKQLDNAVKALDILIIEYDSIIHQRRSILRKKAAVIRALPD